MDIEWRPFEQARAYVRSLKLKGYKEWVTWSKSDERPSDIPASPRRFYDDEWAGWGDWLGTGRVASRKHLPFEEARAYVRSLGLKNCEEWRVWTKSRPPGIRACPENYEQWQGYGDWLGTGNIKPSDRIFRPFEEARTYVRSLGMRSSKEWGPWSKSGKRPQDIPSSPNQVYPEFAGWSDWLGCGFCSFKEARAYVRGLRLKSTREWREWCKSAKRLLRIPTDPRGAYRDEWLGWADWMGCKTIRRMKTFLPFRKARAYARSLRLNGVIAWNAWKKSGKRPKDIPSNPNIVYKSEWKGYRDWLGTSR
jgi:hypothetical protein